MSVAVTKTPMGCGLEAHEWIATKNEIGDYYEVCRGCGKQAAWMPQWPDSPPWATVPVIDEA